MRYPTKATSEYLKDYAFKLSDGKRAHFKLVDASQEKDNIKAEAGKERKFRLHTEEPIRIEGKEVFIQFVYLPEKEKQDSLNKKTIEALLAEVGKKLKDFPELFLLAPTAKNTKRTLLEKHLNSYTARFNFDFFIHKDLGGFLRRELDFYVKNEVLFVDDLDAQDEKKLKSTVAKVKVIKHIAQKIIAFLAQLEDFQKKLWLKKKFVVNCGYCVTLDRVPEALYAGIVKNDAQREEWVKLFAIDEIQGDLTMPAYSQPLTVEFLKANPYLVLDTRHFDENFKDILLAIFDNLDEAIDGVIINSENFQALNMLRQKYLSLVEDSIKSAGASSKSCLIIDFFGGSGTTAHALININREDPAKRKYVLVEMGEYFDTVLKPRIQKVVYSKDWKDGKPVSREGISHMFKYLSLEGYDDTLDNLVATRTGSQQTTLEKMSKQAREDYMLSYMLDIETRASDSLLNIDRFSDPFNYTLKIRRDNELKDQKVDLVETFNYLIGLYVEQVETIRGFKVVRGKLRTGEKTLVIWRNTRDKSNEDLDDFFKKQKYNTLDFEFDLIFVNGDNNLENLKVTEDKWKVRLIEEEFKKRMFEQAV